MGETFGYSPKGSKGMNSAGMGKEHSGQREQQVKRRCMKGSQCAWSRRKEEAKGRKQGPRFMQVFALK